MSNIKIGASIHNKFVFEVRDAETNELKQEAVAYNIVLDNMYTRLCNRQKFFTYIQVGTGTGTLDSARTTLFTYATGKAVVSVEKVLGYPVSYRTAKITINPEELVDYTLTEVGIGTATSGSLVTHALLKDAEGAPISITKTSLDVVIIYATIYFTFSLPVGVAFNNLTTTSTNNNKLFAYLMHDSSFSSASIYYSDNAPKTDLKVIPAALFGAQAGTAITSSVSSDVANKKLILSTVRASVDNFNGHIRELSFSDLFSIFLPNTQYAGTQYDDVPLGTGDGVTTAFSLPSQNIDLATLTVKVAGTLVTPVVGTSYLLTKNADLFVSNNGWSPKIMSNGSQPYYKVNGDYVYPISNYAGKTRYYTYIYDSNGVYGFGAKNHNSDISGLYPDYYRINDAGIATYDYTGYYIYDSDYWYTGPYAYNIPVNRFSTRANRPIFTDDCTLLIISGSNSSVPIEGNKSWVVVYKYNAATTAYDESQVLYAHSGTTTVILGASSSGKYISIRGYNDADLHIFERVGDAYVEMTIDPNSMYTLSASTFPNQQCMFSPDETMFSSTDSTGPKYLFKLTESNTWKCTASYAVVGNANLRFLPHISFNNDLLVCYKSLFKINTDGTLTEITFTCSQLPYFLGFLPDNTILAYIDYVNSDYRTLTTFTLKEELPTVAPPVTPAVGEAVTASYFVEGIHKTNQYVLDIGAEIQFGEITE